MTIRRKTRRRLLFLLTVLILLLGLGAGGWYYRKYRIREGAKVSGAEGMAAVRGEDYSGGIKKLWRYLRHYQDDSEAWYLFGRACRRVPQPGGKHLGSAMHAFQRAIALRPGMLEARRELMEVFASVGYETETVEEADAVLLQAPGDPQALRLKAFALSHLGRSEEAAEVARALTLAVPGDLDAHMLHLGVLAAADGFDVTAREQFLAQLPREELGRHCLVLLEAAALIGTKQGADARELLLNEEGRIKEVLIEDLEDGDYVRHLVSLLDSLDLFGASMEVLLSSPPAASDPVLRRTLVTRLWQNGWKAEVLARTEGLDPGSHRSGTELLALRGLALVVEGREAEAREIAEALESRVWSESALVWAAFLDRVVLDPSAGAGRMAAVCRELLLRAPGNPYLIAAHGEACNRMGETVKAVEAFAAAARLAPAWVYPLLRISEIERKAGDLERALGAALEGARRSPGDLLVAQEFIQVQVALLEKGWDVDPESLLAKVEKLRDAAPDFLGLLPAAVDLLSRTGNEEQAVDALRTALDAPVPPAEELLVRLAGICRTRKLGLAPECLAVAERAYGLSPAIALERARCLSREGDKVGALTAIEDGLSATTSEQKPRWESVRALHLESAGDEGAGAAWVEIADAYPEDLEIQRMVLRSRTAWDDREGVGRTIERLRRLTGEEALSWKLARSRWLLGGEAVSPAQASEAAALLNKFITESPGRVEARILLANAQVRLGERSAAIDTLYQALRLRPNEVGIRLELVGQLLLEMRVEDADRELTRVLESDTMTSDQLRVASALLTKHGRPVESLAVLERIRASERSDPVDLVVARLHAEKGEFEEAERVIGGALVSPRPETLTFAAQLYAAQGRTEDASRALARLDETDLDPASREVLRAVHFRKLGQYEEAMRHFRAATAVDPENGAAWRGQLSLCLLGSAEADIRALIGRARAALPGDEGFPRLDRNWPLLSAAIADEALRPLAVAAVEDPTLWGIAEEVFEVMVGSSAEEDEPPRESGPGR